MPRQVALVIGAGDATGGAIARRFARGGFAACAVRRSAEKLAPLVAEIEAAGGTAHAFGVDARREEAVVGLVETIERDVGRSASMCSTSGRMSRRRSSTRLRGNISRSGRWRASPGS